MDTPPTMNGAQDVDLYAILGIEKTASKAEIKKAYHKGALSNHPDKVSEDERPAAEIKFKEISKAYEILIEDDTRQLYDTHGMAAFDKGNPAGGANMDDINDLFAQMFGGGGMGGMGGMPGMAGMGGMPGGPRRPRKGRNDEQVYEVSLEELYKGKTVHFASTKNVICSLCSGTGGKSGAKAKQCETCKGQGLTTKLQSVGPGLVTQATVTCGTCNGAGSFFKEKERCKKCKGARVVREKKPLELYIPRGAREGEHIVLAGEADQHPDQEPGDIIFELKEKKHDTFDRAGADLSAELNVTLAEALTGFNRVILTHLDGRGISINHPQGKVLRPGEILRIEGEGMPQKKSDAMGDLYLAVNIEFPEDEWSSNPTDFQKLREVLPEREVDPDEKQPDTVDEVEFESDANIEDFGAGSGDPRAADSGWEDDEEGAQPGCAQQ